MLAVLLIQVVLMYNVKKNLNEFYYNCLYEPESPDGPNVTRNT